MIEVPDDEHAQSQPAGVSWAEILQTLFSSGDHWLTTIANELSPRVGLIRAPSRIA
jgi:hypothetical protein